MVGKVSAGDESNNEGCPSGKAKGTVPPGAEPGDQEGFQKKKPLGKKTMEMPRLLCFEQ